MNELLNQELLEKFPNSRVYVSRNDYNDIVESIEKVGTIFFIELFENNKSELNMTLFEQLVKAHGIKIPLFFGREKTIKTYSTLFMIYANYLHCSLGKQIIRRELNSPYSEIDKTVFNFIYENIFENGKFLTDYEFRSIDTQIDKTFKMHVRPLEECVSIIQKSLLSIIQQKWQKDAIPLGRIYATKERSIITLAYNSSVKSWRTFMSSGILQRVSSAIS